MAKYLAGIDAGTTGARCMIVDLNGNVISTEYHEYPCTYPKPGWVDQDGELLISKAMEACRGAVAKSGVDPKEIGSVGLSSQRSVTTAIDKNGKMLRPMISWQDSRTGAEVAEISKMIDPAEFYNLSGLPMGTVWIITKILWMRKNEPELYQRVYKFVQNQELVLKAFGAEDYYSDLGDITFTGVWDVKAVQWSDQLMKLFGLSPDMFGKPTICGTQVGVIPEQVAEKTGFAPGTPLCVGAGDQNCGLVGMGSIKHGIASVNLGTAGLAILSLGKPIPPTGGMFLVNHAVKGMWQMEGLSNAAASCYRWYRDTVGTLEKELESRQGRNAYEYLNDLAATAPAGSKGLLFIPYLASAATPRWNVNARAAFVGMSFAHGRAEMTRAVLEGVALEMRDVMNDWYQSGAEINIFRLGGGATRSPLWNQIQADVYGKPVQTLKVGESTVLGAAMLGGVGAGIFKSIDEAVDQMVQVTSEIQPVLANHRIYEEMYQSYVKVYDGLAQNGAYEQLARIQAS